MTAQRYGSIVADPPWPVGWRPGSSRRASGTYAPLAAGGRLSRTRALPYTRLSVAAIAALPVAELAADDCLLWLWATRRVFRDGDAARVARAWGFEPFAETIWGLRNPGMGGAAGNDHEPVLIARRGRATLASTVPLGVVFWRQPYAHDGRAPYKVHSAKPDGLLDLVEQVSPPPRLELFARRQRLGWDTWGAEAFAHVELEADA